MSIQKTFKNCGKALKLCSFFLCVVTLLSAVGCSYSDYKEPENRTFVSAVALDRSQEKLLLTAELIRIKESLNNDEYTVSTISGVGKTPDEAMRAIVLKNSKELDFSHCAVLGLGDSLTSEQVTRMLQYWFKERTLTLSVRLVMTEDAAALFSANEDGEKPVGYEISEMIKNDYNNTFKIKSCRLLDFINAQDGKKKAVQISYFTVKKNKGGTVFYPDGIVQFKDGQRTLKKRR